MGFDANKGLEAAQMRREVVERKNDVLTVSYQRVRVKKDYLRCLSTYPARQETGPPSGDNQRGKTGSVIFGTERSSVRSARLPTGRNSRCNILADAGSR
jgi:hypothetical protein